MMKISQLPNKRFILFRPSNQNPVPPPMLSQHINRQNNLDIMCCVEVIIVIIDINDDEGSFAPYVYDEVEEASIGFLVWEYLANEIV